MLMKSIKTEVKWWRKVATMKTTWLPCLSSITNRSEIKDFYFFQTVEAKYVAATIESKPDTQIQ